MVANEWENVLFNTATGIQHQQRRDPFFTINSHYHRHINVSCQQTHMQVMLTMFNKLLP